MQDSYFEPMDKTGIETAPVETAKQPDGKGGLRARYIAGAIGLIVVLIVGGLAGSFLTVKTGKSPFGQGKAVPMFISNSEPNSAGLSVPGGSFAPVVKSVLPTVVNIASTKVVSNSDNEMRNPFLNDPFFRQFFGGDGPNLQVPKERREQSLGSGVIVSPDGYILTNNHVVDQASDIKVSLSDKTEYKAKVIGTDPKTDIAVLKIEAGNLPSLSLGDSSQVQVGDIALAIGNPFGIGQTVTMGIVSATGRGNLNIEDYEDFIQTDAAINPGNSGGALINSAGALIGINTAILSNGAQGNQGVGFAVPINMARQVMEQILKNGKVIRGYLGVVIQDVTPQLAKAFGADQPKGALVGDVTPDGPGAGAGLQKGDIILEVNGEPITDSRALKLKIGGLAPGTSVKLKVFRDGSTRDVTVTLGELPSDNQAVGQQSRPSKALEGLQVDELTPQIAQQLKLSPQTRGVVVTDVQSGSAAAEAGIRPRDVIQQVNHKPVTSVSDFENDLNQAGKQSVLLLVNRGGNTVFLVVEPR